MTAVHLRGGYRKFEEEKARQTPKGQIQYDHEIGPPEQDDPHDGVKADQYSKLPARNLHRRWQKHSTDSANRFIFGTSNKPRVVHAVNGINVVNSTVGQSVGRSPASTPPWAIGMPYQGRGGSNPLFVSPYSPYAARPAPRQTKHQQRTSNGLPPWILGNGPAPWLNSHGKAAVPKKKKSGKQPRRTRHWSGF